jgi:hypothetical protein
MVLLSNLFLSLLLFVLLVLFVFKFVSEREQDFQVNYQVLINIVEIYKETIFLNSLSIMEKQYNLDTTSKVNSQVSFEKAKDELVAESTKIIIKSYLSEKCLKSLLRHYNIDGLSLLIITHLKR